MPRYRGRSWWFLLLLLCLPGAVIGAEDEQALEEERIRQSLTLLLPDLSFNSIKPTVIPGLYEVVFGGRIGYFSADGRYLIQGEIYDMETQESITEPRLRKVTLEAVDALGEESMMVFEPDKFKYTVTVFTDVDSAFSRKLHRELAEYAKQGIRLRYLFFPRAGPSSPSYAKAVTVWCSEDRKQAMDQAITGQEMEKRVCDNPIAEHMAMGKRLGVTGVPVLLLENGEMLPGYVAAERLADILKRMSRESDN